MAGPLGFALLMLLPAAGAAQSASVLTGRALDVTTEAPAVAAQVELLRESGGRVATVNTDSTGRFTFRDVAPASYQLRVKSSQHREVTTPALRVSANDTSEVIVWLAVDAIALAPLEVTARTRTVVRRAGLQAFHDGPLTGLDRELQRFDRRAGDRDGEDYVLMASVIEDGVPAARFMPLASTEGFAKLTAPWG